MNIHHITALQSAHLTIQRQEDVLAGATKLYGACPAEDADAYRNMAHAALDAILDAPRGKYLSMEQLLRGSGGE